MPSVLYGMHADARAIKHRKTGARIKLAVWRQTPRCYRGFVIAPSDAE
jgi:hypothetical protein